MIFSKRGSIFMQIIMILIFRFAGLLSRAYICRIENIQKSTVNQFIVKSD
jgi:hypothetical protein